jgi:hypothetical protein
MTKLKLFFCTTLFVMFFQSASYADDLEDAWDASGCRNDMSSNCDGACTRNGSGAILLNSDGGPTDAGSSKIRDNCNETPDFYRLTFYKAGLCKQSPISALTATNPTDQCYEMLNIPTGRQLTLQNTSAGVITDKPLVAEPMQFEPGEYRYAYAVISNALQIKHTESYSAAVEGYTAGGDRSSGVACWTNTNVTTYNNATASMRGGLEPVNFGDDGNAGLGNTCGALADANPQFATELIENMHDDHDNGGLNAINTNWRAWDSTSFQSFNDGAFSDLSMAKLLQSDNFTTATGLANAHRIFYVVQFSNPLVFTEDSTQFEMSFNLSGSVSVDFASDGSFDGQLIAVKNGADPFQVIFTVR